MKIKEVFYYCSHLRKTIPRGKSCWLMGTRIWKWNHYCGEAKLKEQAGFLLVGAGHACPGILERPACEKARLIATGFIHLSSL